jgi:hypothetical protein
VRAVSDREQRQFSLMREGVAKFRAAEVPIGRLIADLEGLLGALQETPESWRDRFTEEWSVLEIAYAVALDRRTPIPTAASGEIAEALGNMDRLLDEVQGQPRA